MGCNGRCCVAFTLNHTLDDAGDGSRRDGDLLRFMLRPLTPEEAVGRIERLYHEDREPDDHQRYRCIYFDEETRLCGAYENRPTMCRDYPYPTYGSGECSHGCDCKGAPLISEVMD